MRIIKAGDPKKNKNRLLKSTCNNCGCIIEYAMDECTLIEDVVGTPGTYGIECPNCGCWLYPKEDEI